MDLLAAAKNRPVSGRVAASGLSRKICCSSPVLELARNRAIDGREPISPMQLHRIAGKDFSLSSLFPNLLDSMCFPEFKL